MSPKACNLKRNSGNLFSIDIVKNFIIKNAKTSSVYVHLFNVYCKIT